VTITDARSGVTFASPWPEVDRMGTTGSVTCPDMLASGANKRAAIAGKIRVRILGIMEVLVVKVIALQELVSKQH
jgi:hypothetical protein